MHPNLHRMAQQKIRQKIEERAARPNILGSLGDFISSIGYSIKERFDSAGRELNDLDDLGDLIGVPPYGGNPGSYDGGATIVTSPNVTKARYVIMPLTLKIDGGYWHISTTPEQTTEPITLTEIDGETAAPPNAIVALHARPQVIIRPEQLFLDSEEAKNFEIYDIRVGKNSQLTNSGGVAAKFFGEGNQIRLKMDTVQISMDFAVLVRNKTDRPQKLHGMLLGPMVE